MKSNQIEQTKSQKSPTEGFQKPVTISYLVTVVSNLMAFGGSKENIDRYGLTVMQFRLMGIIWQLGPMTLSDISQTIHFDKSTLSRAAGGLQKKVLIYKEPNRRHKSSPFLCLTDEGKMLIEEINPAYRKRAKKLTSALSDEEQTQLINILEKLKDHIEDVKAFENWD